MKSAVPGEKCPCCPIEVRDLFAVAHNFALRIQGGSTSSDTTAADLWAAVEAMQPLMDAHFADENHSHPRRSGDTEPH